MELQLWPKGNLGEPTDRDSVVVSYISAQLNNVHILLVNT